MEQSWSDVTQENRAGVITVLSLSARASSSTLHVLSFCPNGLPKLRRRSMECQGMDQGNKIRRPRAEQDTGQDSDRTGTTGYAPTKPGRTRTVPLLWMSGEERAFHDVLALMSTSRV
eukprot:752783-Hanusia_phi.AAC.3